MADISKIQLPGSNQVYNIKDAVAREMFEIGFQAVMAWDGSSTPVVSQIPDVVDVTYGGRTYTGELQPGTNTTGKFYLISYETSDGNDIYEEYITVNVGQGYSWERIGTTQIDISNVVTGVTLNKNSTSVMTGLGTADTASVVGANATFAFTVPTVSVTPTTKYLTINYVPPTISGNGSRNVLYGFNSHTTEAVAKSLSVTKTNKLVTTTVPNVTNVGSASSWEFKMGTGTNSETLIISGGNSTVPTLGTAKTVATGSITSSGTGSAVVTDVSVASTANAITELGSGKYYSCLTGVEITNTPSVTLSTSSTTSTGAVKYTETVSGSASGGSVTWDNKDLKTVVTGYSNPRKENVLNPTTSITVTKGE